MDPDLVSVDLVGRVAGLEDVMARAPAGSGVSGRATERWDYLLGLLSPLASTNNWTTVEAASDRTRTGWSG